jgi:hypothetical protein
VPKRVVIRPALSYELAWSKRDGVFYFRLLNGERPATLPLKLDAYDMNLLSLGSRVDLFDRKGKKWLQLASDRREIHILFDAHRGKGIETDFLANWPPFPFGDFMAYAGHLRGAPPTEGWEKIADAILEARRGG